MKRALVAIVIAALAAVIIILIVKPDLLDRFQPTEPPRQQEEPSTVDRPEEAPSPPPASAPDKEREPEPEKPVTATIVLDQLSGRSVYVNGADQTGRERCPVPPGQTVVATWQDGRYSHERIDTRAGENVSPEARLEKGTSAPAWTGFQGGPARTGLADAGTQDGFTLRWEGRMEDGVRSSPVIQGGMAFLATDTSFVRAVDLSNGKQLWSHGIVGGKVNPVAVGDFVFAGNDVGRFEGFRAAKGKLKGTASLGSGLSGLATVSDDLLLAATSGGMLLAIETRKSMVGRLPLKYKWEVTVPGFGGSTATPLILGGRAILQTTEGQLLCISTANGHMIWPAGLETTEGAEAAPDPDASMTFRFVGSQGFLTATPAADRGVIYAAHGNRIWAVKADDGTQLWERKIDADVSSSVSSAWGTIYVGCTDGSIRAFSCGGGLPLFRARLGENPIFASPVLFAGQLLAATGEGKLILLDAFSGKALSEDSTLAGTPIDAIPAVWPGGILAVNRDGAMACYK